MIPESSFVQVGCTRVHSKDPEVHVLPSVVGPYAMLVEESRSFPFDPMVWGIELVDDPYVISLLSPYP